MDSSSPRPADRVLGGTARMFLADALMIPTGPVPAGILARQLGCEGDGELVLASAARRVAVAVAICGGAALWPTPGLPLLGELDAGERDGPRAHPGRGITPGGAAGG